MSTARKQPKKRLGKGLSAILDTSPSPVKPRPVEVAAPSTQTPEKNELTTRHTNGEAVSLPELSDSSVKPHDAATKAEPAGSATAGGGIHRLAVDAIVPGTHQPRKQFEAGALESLAASIRSVGVIQPITVRPHGADRFELIAGERRWRAARLTGLTEIPAIVTDANEQVAAETALIENLQREDLNPIERGDAIRGLIESFGFTQATVAERVGLDRSSVSNLLRLADLEEPIRDILASGLLGLGHGKALLSFPPGRGRIDAAAKASREGWSVRRLEEESRRIRAADGGGSQTGKGGGDDQVETRALEKRLGEHLGTKVALRVDRSGKGVVQIRFFDLDHFDDLMSRIGFDPSADS